MVRARCTTGSWCCVVMALSCAVVCRGTPAHWSAPFVVLAKLSPAEVGAAGPPWAVYGLIDHEALPILGLVLACGAAVASCGVAAARPVVPVRLAARVAVIPLSALLEERVSKALLGRVMAVPRSLSAPCDGASARAWTVAWVAVVPRSAVLEVSVSSALLGRVAANSRALVGVVAVNPRALPGVVTAVAS